MVDSSTYRRVAAYSFLFDPTTCSSVFFSPSDRMTLHNENFIMTPAEHCWVTATLFWNPITAHMYKESLDLQCVPSTSWEVSL